MQGIPDLNKLIVGKQKGIRIELNGAKTEAIITTVINGEDLVFIAFDKNDLESLINVMQTARRAMV